MGSLQARMAAVGCIVLAKGWVEMPRVINLHAFISLESRF